LVGWFFVGWLVGWLEAQRYLGPKQQLNLLNSARGASS
jgi:hypothetical protein